MSTEVPAPLAEYMGFVGVSTQASSINRVFPRWADILRLPTRRLVGHDLPLDASRADYRELVDRIRSDDHHRGALVTTHKLGVYQAASDLFDEVDDFARLCGEISSISKRGPRLVGHAKDPLTAGLSLEEFLATDAFADGGGVVCLGAGGAGIAATWYLARRAGRPTSIVCTDTDAARLIHLRGVHERGGLDADLFEYVRVASSADTDRVLAAAPAGSLVINASGLGKDRPGSPLSDDVLFPQDGYAWDMNYRGQLHFLAQARQQATARGLTVVDGWRYFIHGWSQVVAEVFAIDLTPEIVEDLARSAGALR